MRKVSSFLCFITLLLFTVHTALSYTLNECFINASRRYNLPVKLLKSIAKTESDFNIFAVNVSGRSYKPKTLQKAVGIINKFKNKSFDIGIMQVNKIWFKKLGYPYIAGFDPCFNIMLGAYILRKKIDRYGENWFGIAAYHSTSLEKNVKYAWTIYRNLQQQ